jgi:hypothetical protein
MRAGAAFLYFQWDAGDPRDVRAVRLPKLRTHYKKRIPARHADQCDTPTTCCAMVASGKSGSNFKAACSVGPLR